MAAFQGKIDLNNLANYAGQPVPPYIRKFNDTNFITNAGATLGRVLFYDKNLSSTNTISCASCHKQANAFGDDTVASIGANGITGRHAMRLITKLSATSYYPDLFKFVYGSSEITEAKMQLALGHFIRSIQSFDSKYDSGRANAVGDVQNFTNFTAEENLGKTLFFSRPVFSGSTRTGGGTDTTVTRSPSLRDLAAANGQLNGPLMHDGSKQLCRRCSIITTR